MTLELTPEQRADLKAALSFGILHLDHEIGDDPRLSQSQRQTGSATKQRLESLRDLLAVPHTTITLHQP
jgi:hypothetical protein